MILHNHPIHNWPSISLLLTMTILSISGNLQSQDNWVMEEKQNLFYFENQAASELNLATCGGLAAPQYSKADLNNDGDSELFIFDRVDNHAIVLERIDDTWRYSQDLLMNFPNTNGFALLRDYNCDGIADLFTNSGSNNVAIYTGSYDAENKIVFSLLMDNIVCTNGALLLIAPYDLPGIADINNDGFIDILTFNINGGLVEFYQNMTESCDQISFRLMDECWGDFYESGLSTLLDLDDCEGGIMEGAAPKNALHAGSTLCVMDFNNDNLQELLLGDILYDNINLVSNDGTSDDAHIYAQDPEFPSNNTSVDLKSFPACFNIDVNEDGLEDLLVAPNSAVQIESYYSTWYYENVGSTESYQFSLVQKDYLVDQMVDIGKYAYPYFFDYNGDGLEDIVMGVGESNVIDNTNDISSLWLYEQYPSENGVLNFRLITNDYLSLSSLFFIHLIPSFGDMDNDGDKDLVIGTGGSALPGPTDFNGTLLYVENTTGTANGIQSFGDPQFMFGGIDVGQYSAPELYDVNADGKLDLIIGEKVGIVNYYENTSTSGGFSFDELSDPAFGWGGVDVRYVDGINQPTGTGYAIPRIITRDEDGTMDLFVSSENNSRLYHYDGIEAHINEGNFNLVQDTVAFHTGLRFCIAFLKSADPNKYLAVIGNQKGGILSAEFYKNTTGIAPITPLSKIQLYPNPAGEYIQIESPVQNGDYIAYLTIIDINGKELMRNTINENNLTLDISMLKPGYYFARLITKDYTGQQKFIKY